MDDSQDYFGLTGSCAAGVAGPVVDLIIWNGPDAGVTADYLD